MNAVAKRRTLPDLREFARGQDCLIRIPGVCRHDPETTVLCHDRGAGTAGMGQKPCDFVGAHGCDACHAVVDGRARCDFTRQEIELMFAHGVYRTLEKVWRYLQ